MNGKRTNIIRKGLVAVSISGALVLGLGAVGASASNGAANSSDRSHEAHDEHEKDHDGIGHSDNEDHVGDGRGHVSHGNGHGYGHGDDHHDENADIPPSSESAPTGSVDKVIDVVVPAADQPLSTRPEVNDAPESTVPAVQNSSLVDNVNVPTDVVVTEPVTIPAIETTFSAPTEGETSPAPLTNELATDSPATDSPAANNSVNGLPMTGSSLVLMGLASVLAAGGFVVLVARRRRDEVVA
jgi:LPXTG-motif cell wall-anchored protein